MSTTQALQEELYGQSVDYRHGSPHLSHWPLYDRLTEVLRAEVRRLDDAGLPLRALEIGAGHGGYTEPMLAAGCSVTAVEMSRPSLAELNRRFGTNPRFEGVFDRDGSLSSVDDRFSLAVCVSVLHHIPDYLGFLDILMRHVAEGGTLVTFQDPLWYPRVGKASRIATLAGFYSWRLAQGNLARGLGTVGRRLRGRYDEDNPSDMVEYHVVRAGVDERAVQTLVADRFESADLLPYWSSQAPAGQRAGERLGLVNTFGVVARGARRPA